MNTKDLVGMKFGRLSVLEKTTIKDKWNKCFMWKCQCDCGNTCTASTFALTNGLKRSCGCLKASNADLMRERQQRVDGTVINLLESNKVYTNNTSGYRGVSYKKDSGKWWARISFKGKSYSLGFYYTAKEASEAYQEAKEHLHGEFIEWYNNQNKEEKEMVNVDYKNGQSAYGDDACVYMLADLPEGQRLYAEVLANDYDDVDDPDTDELIYEKLKAEILEQAKAADFPLERLRFFRD